MVYNTHNTIINNLEHYKLVIKNAQNFEFVYILYIFVLLTQERFGNLDIISFNVYEEKCCLEIKVI